MANEFTRQEILESLRSTPIMSLAVNSRDFPVATVILFAVDDDFTFYFSTRLESYKSRAIRSDNKVSFSVWENKKMLTQASGIASQITDPHQVDVILDKIVKSSEIVEDFWPPVLRIHSGESYAVYKIKLIRLRSMDLRNTSIHSPELPFTEISFNG